MNPDKKTWTKTMADMKRVPLTLLGVGFAEMYVTILGKDPE